MTAQKTAITVAEGDGIGPEIMAATLHVLKAAGANLEIHKIDVGEKVFLRGCPTGIEPSAWEIIHKTKCFLKAPITTPQGGGFKSLNVTIRTSMGLYANIRPCVAYHPFISTLHPKMDVVVVRENEEDLYTGIEYRQSEESVHALKIMTRPGCEKIVRYAFEYALANNRKKVTCFTKDNILKLSDGLFHKTFDVIAKDYPTISNEHWIIDIGAAKLADTPTAFDVVVMPNLYGDILSDVAAQIAGSVGLAASANIGDHGAMFEAIHGSAPRRAGQNVANPSGLILASVLMLVHIGQTKVATLLHNAWLKTIEEGIHTYDIYKEGTSKQKVGTKEFAEAVAKRIGKEPETLKSVQYAMGTKKQHKVTLDHHPMKKELKGIDIFIESKESVEKLQQKISQCLSSEFKLTMIANRGAKVWPNEAPQVTCVDQWRCRFMSTQENGTLSPKQIVALLQRFADGNIPFVQTQQLYTFNGEVGYS